MPMPLETALRSLPRKFVGVPESYAREVVIFCHEYASTHLDFNGSKLMEDFLAARHTHPEGKRSFSGWWPHVSVLFAERQGWIQKASRGKPPRTTKRGAHTRGVAEWRSNIYSGTGPKPLTLRQEAARLASQWRQQQFVNINEYTKAVIHMVYHHLKK